MPRRLSPGRPEARYLALTVVTVAVGLGVHRLGGALPPVLRDIAGDALWAAMIYWLMGTVAPSASPLRRAAAAAAVCAAVEGSQLLRVPWLVALRETTLGHLVLGSDFDARDLVAYAAGVVGAAIVDQAIWRVPTGAATPLRYREHRVHAALLLVVLAQAAHSVEEYATGLYDVLAPARFISSLLSRDLATGFLLANLALVAFGVWSWAVPMRRGWPSARALAWFWALLELANGIGHSALALANGGYFPGALTAPLLLLSATWLVTSLRK